MSMVIFVLWVLSIAYFGFFAYWYSLPFLVLRTVVNSEYAKIPIVKSYLIISFLTLCSSLLNIILLLAVMYQGISVLMKFLIFLGASTLSYKMTNHLASSKIKLMQENELSKTPFDEYHYILRSTKKVPAKDKNIDFFISYKSEDAHLARLIADQLTTNSYKVWFAENIILITNRDRFHDLIEEGIQRSQKGIVIAGTAYHASKYCLFELDGLLKQGINGPSNLLTIATSARPSIYNNFPQLGNSHQILYHGNVNHLLASLGSAVTIQRPIPLLPEEERKLHSDEKCGYQISMLSSWKLKRKGRGVTRYGYEGPVFAGNFLGHPVICSINIGPMFSFLQGPLPFSLDDVSYIQRTLKSVVQVFHHPALVQDDRENYNRIIEMNREFLGQFSSKCGGIHLFFYAGKGHLVTTYWADMNWARRYHIFLPEPLTEVGIEFNIVFNFYGTFLNYCRFTSIMDEIARSLNVLD